MRAVLQKVESASVVVGNQIRGKINKGLLIFLGIEHGDTNEDSDYLINKIVSLRIFNDASGVMNLSLKDVDGDLLLISQFTLHALTKKGNRPSYIRAASKELSEPIYNQFILNLETNLQKPIQTGIFGADMKISLVNDGPVTIILDSKNKDF